MNNLYSVLTMSDSKSILDPNKNKAFDDKLVIDYPRVTLNKNEATSPSDNRGGFSISYPNTSSENNVFYTSNKLLDKTTISSKFMHTSMSIYKTLHYNIKGITTTNDNIVGELIIEHTESDRSSQKLYSCYLLETSSLVIADENVIDKIISITDRQSPTIDADLNAILPKQDSGIVYIDGKTGNYICVFTTPIQINTASKDKIVNNYGNVTNLFEISPRNGKYLIIPENNIAKRDAEEIYIDCSPTGASEEEQNTYNIPINSKMATETQESDFMKTTVNYGIFVLTMLVSYITVPLLYKNLVIDGSSIANPTDDIARFTRIRAADILLGISMFALTAILISSGAADDDYKLMSGGIFTFVFSILSYGLIQIKKMDLTFMTTTVKGTDVKNDQKSEAAGNIEALPFDDLWPTINVVLATMISSDSLSAYFAVSLMSIIILSILYLFGSFDLVSYGNFTGISAGIFVLVSIIIGIKKKFEAQKG